MRADDEIRALLKEAGEGFDLSRIFAGTNPTISQLRANFLIARNQISYDKIQKEVQDHQRREALELASKEENSQGQDSIHMLVILLSERMAELDKELAERYERLKEKYGEDVIGGMAAAFLTEEQLATLTTDAEKSEALRWQFLDENGEIRSGYEDIEEALYMRASLERQKIGSTLEQYQNHKHFTADQIKTVEDALENLSDVDRKNSTLTLDIPKLYDSLDQKQAEQEATQHHSNLNFE